MTKFANKYNSWLNWIMKIIEKSLKKKFLFKYFEKDAPQYNAKQTDINVLLNRVKLNQKNESRKKLYFSAAASTGLILFGLIIF